MNDRFAIREKHVQYQANRITDFLSIELIRQKYVSSYSHWRISNFSGITPEMSETKEF